MLSLVTKQSGDELFPHSDLRGGVFLGEISSSKHYSKKEKKKEQHNYKIGTCNLRTLSQGGKLENLKKEIQKNEVSILCVSEVRWKGNSGA
jgi:hypothetical protein